MKTPYKNIYNVLRLNRFIVLAVVLGAVLTSIISILLTANQYKKMISSAFVVSTSGNVIPLKLVSQKENLEVEVKAHLELFHRYFYQIDASSYEKQLEKALWLGNSTVDQVFRQKKADGVYNRLLQYSLVQKVIAIESKINIEKEPYKFETRTVFQINRGKTIDTYELLTTGNLIHVDRNFPKNTHGLLITNFFENTLKRLSQDEI